MAPIGSKWYHWIADTSLPNLYAISAAIIIAICLIYWLTRDVWRWAWTGRHVFCRRLFRSKILVPWRRFAFVHMPRCMRWLDISSYRQALVLAVILAGNIVGLRLRAHSWAEAQKRAGSMAVINLVPLCTGISFGLPADLLHVDRQMLAWFHRWVGRICVLHSLLHCSLLVTVARTTNLANSGHLVPIAAGGALILVIPVTCAAVQRRHLQFAMKCHYLLAATAIGALIYHLVERQSLYRWYLVGAICLWIFISAVACTMAAWDQKPWRSSRNGVVMNSVSHFLWLDIEIPLHRAIRPGQCVQLWMPRAGFRAFFQLPRFYVAFWEDGPTQRMVRMVADPEPGLTRKLYHEALTSPAKQPVIIFGPYGHPLDFYRFGTILFVVEDIGFFRALSYIEMLVEASRKREVMVRKLEVLWKRRVGKDENPQWVNKWMQDLFNRDWKAFKILRFSIYCPRTQSSPQETPLSYEHNAMLCYFYGSIKIEEEVARHLDNQCGAMAVAGNCPQSDLLPLSCAEMRIIAVPVLTAYAVCAGPPIREAVIKTVQPHTGRNLRLIVFDPDISPTPDGNEDLPSSVESAIDRQAPPEQGSGAGEDKRIHQVRPFPADSRELQYSLPKANDTQTGKVELSNHSKWVENKLAQGRRRPTVTITEL